MGRYTFVAVAIAFCANIKSANAADDIDVLYHQPTISDGLNDENEVRTIMTGLLRGSIKTANCKSDFDESLEERGFSSSELARTNLVAISSGGGGVTHGQPKVPQKS
ncbi:RxLR-like protein [Plasmopara halstedii]|uniref:RxLR-like protein n=1 Tax=Plasmopara halstedii TaxID=4781 RepID=A0A0P1AN29_PLAHL|nr:RxLR-like protein [Plasmopara halstedii]CEG42489.1 RxLR-like protein [Plasmopara halstedii]|eukprot:XP_024578858.1 RxLR-like protein [Plasmopara halstedii]